MPILTNVPSQLDNILTLALVAALALVVIIAIICKAVKNKKTAAAPQEEAIVEEVMPTAAPGSAGQLKIHDVEPKTAAMLMAIVADRLQKPLNELRFVSIKEVK
ncbi:MAG: hypothetical protein J6Q92_04415 [Oscillospiraceae bacterium]|nr:hypothetical protein [Oscillospiraceae bacterium]